MAIITISSDLGENNYSFAMLHASLKREFPQDDIIPLYQQNDVYDIESMAYHLMGGVALFPKETIHLAFCKYSLTQYHLILVHVQGQYILTSDNGLCSAIDGYEAMPLYRYPSTMMQFDFQKYLSQYMQVIRYIRESSYSSKLESNPNYVQTKPFNTGRMLMADRLVTRVVAISLSGNIILNISQKQFQDSVGSQPFYIQFFTIKIRSISPNYMASETNNRMGAIFNEAGYMEIFMIGGHIAKLFNITKYTNNKIEIVIGHDSNSQINF